MLIQISKCLGKSFQHNGHGVDAKDLAEKMQRLSTEVSKCAHKMYIFKSFQSLSFVCQVLQPLFNAKCSLLYFQRPDEGTAVADARTSGSVSPADFFSQTPQDNSNFQIPVSCGKIPHRQTQFIMWLKQCRYLTFQDWRDALVVLLKIPMVW